MSNDYSKFKIYPPCLFPEKTDTISNIFVTMNQDINHTEEVVIGSEQGTTFPTKIGTSLCNALIDTGAIRSCISEKYYQNLSVNENSILAEYQCKISPLVVTSLP